MRTGIFGGTFDPIHTGHIAILTAAASNGYLDRILVVPSACPPHKPAEQVSMATYRFEMTRIVLENCKFDIPVEISDLELFRKGKSYTIDTILELKKNAPKDHEFVLIYGSDIVFDIEKWHKPQEIMRECELFLAKRPGFTGTHFEQKIEELKETFHAVITLFPSDYIDISSHEVRKLLVEDSAEAIPFLQPQLYEWIAKNKIYKNQEYFTFLDQSTIHFLRDFELRLQKILKRDRLIHSINTMREAMKLAILFGGDIDKAAIAGLLHDCAKSKNVSKATLKGLQQDPNLEDPDLSPDIMHAYLGKQLAADHFGITDPDILNAIYYHTTGRAEASLLEKIIFVADKIEPARTFPGIRKIRETAYEDLDLGLLACLHDIIQLLQKSNKIVHPDSIHAYEIISEEKTKGGKYMNQMTPNEMADEIYTILDNKKGIDIQKISLEGKTIISDYFIIASGTSTPHVRALSDEVELKMKEQYQLLPLHVEGHESGRWILLDYGCVIVHVFHPEERTFYSLEKLWSSRTQH